MPTVFAFKLQPKHLTFASKFAQSFYHVDCSILFVKSALKDEMNSLLHKRKSSNYTINAE